MDNKERKIYDFSESQLKEIFTRLGLDEHQAKRASEDYFSYRESEVAQALAPYSLGVSELYSIEEMATRIASVELEDGGDIIAKILKANYWDIYEYLWTIDYRAKMARVYKDTGSWEEVYYSIYEGEEEAFITLIETEYKTRVKDVAHLQELTGITTLKRWNNDKEKFLEVETEEEAKELAWNTLGWTLQKAGEIRYHKALSRALKEGAKYKELLEIDPKEFNLSKGWIEEEGYNALLQTLHIELSLGDAYSLMYRPSLRAIAKEIEAPYSILLDAYSYYNDIHRDKEDIQTRLKRRAKLRRKLKEDKIRLNKKAKELKEESK